MPTKYATGAGLRLKAAPETTTGVLPSTGWRQFIAQSIGLSPEGNMEQPEYLGEGRNAGRSQKRRTAVDGPIVLPLEARNTGFWCQQLFGAPTTSTVKAKGYIAFSGQPAADSTITLGGTVVTAKASGATGAQFNIGATIDETVTNACSALNASADAELAKCTYTPNTTLDRIEIERDLAGAAGNTFTLAVSAGLNATRSAATLLGGGYKHVWLSGAGTLPTFSVERGWPSLDSPFFQRLIGCAANSFEIPMEQEGDSIGTLNVIARQSLRAPITVEASPEIVPVDMFDGAFNRITVGGTSGVAVSSGNLTMTNNLDPVYLMNGSEIMDEATPGTFGCTGEATARFRGGADTILEIAEAFTSTEILYGKGTAAAWTLSVRMPNCKIKIPRIEVGGPGGVDLPIMWQADNDDTLGAKAEITLITDVASYA